ncbi:Hypothetical protein HVIM_04250 [Roseomonas mucosa]|nr:Hypothetical protein HVIM_04250 [Roseomonas mucosa]QDD99822.1 Hypothetical protein ADP8_04250 [Roseomonas mucosa]UZO92114.1 Hypothetical protein RMP42_04250 [Roseomonas mucosa]
MCGNGRGAWQPSPSRRMRLAPCHGAIPCPEIRSRRYRGARRGSWRRSGAGLARMLLGRHSSPRIGLPGRLPEPGRPFRTAFVARTVWRQPGRGRITDV